VPQLERGVEYLLRYESRKGEGPTATVGECLRQLRETKGLSQAELGRMLGLSGPTISRYERGEMQIDADDLPRFAELLGAHPAQFFDTPAPTRLPTAVPLSTAGEAFLDGIDDALENLAPHDRETVERILGLMSHVLTKAG
jgi:transcriptional regulator with XRE-family HTH domain